MKNKIKIFSKADFLKNINLKGDGYQDYQVDTINSLDEVESLYVKVFTREEGKIQGKDGYTIAREKISDEYPNIKIRNIFEIEPKDL